MISTPSKTSVNAYDFPVKTVTIFQSSTAELTRTITVDLVSGRNVLEITGISSRVDKESPRIHGLGPDARVFDISCDTNLANAPRPRILKPNAQALKELLSKHKTLELERDLRRTECNMLDNAAKSLANGPPTHLDGFMDNYIGRKRAAMQAVRECEEKITVVETEMWAQTKEGEVAGRVEATLLAIRECKVTFQLTYLVSGVSWTPYYDLHATTSEGKPSSEVTLLYCANITQKTGEDWNNTILTLSTANSQALRNLSVPVLNPLKVCPSPKTKLEAKPAVTIIQPPGQFYGLRPGFAAQSGVPLAQVESVHDSRYATREFKAASMYADPETASFVPPPISANSNSDSDSDSADFVPPHTTVDHSPLSLSYCIEGLVTLPSDRAAHKVSIAMLDFTAELKYVCVPRKNTSTFIQGRIKNTSEYELLAGPVSVFMDDGFVTKTSFDLISVNESFDCVLGIDTALRIAYQRSHTEHSEPARSFAEPTKTTTCTITTTATNGHAFDVSNLIIRDTIPLGNEDGNIKVMLRKPDGLANAKDGEEVTVSLAGEVKEGTARWSKVENGKGGEKDGMYEWVCVVSAGQKVSLEAEWVVKAPGNVKWEER